MGVPQKFAAYFDNTFFTEHLRTTASVPFRFLFWDQLIYNFNQL